jgi:hypothetical protein
MDEGKEVTQLRPNAPGPSRRPRTDADFAAPADDLLESKKYQAQLAWTVAVALGVAVAAFFQAASRTSQPILTQDAVERLRGDPLYNDALRASLEPLPPDVFTTSQEVLISSGGERRPATLQLYSSGRAPAKRPSE